MKKNRMMRLASFLLVCVLLTTSVISGTYAKYVTTGEASDSARVAKWGVEVAAVGTLFSDEYEAKEEILDNDGEVIGITVKSSLQDNVVAPGTESGDGITFKIQGTPEVAVSVNVSLAVQDIYVSYRDGSFPVYDFTVEEEVRDSTVTLPGGSYYPIQYTLKNGAGETLKTGTLADIKTFFEGINGNYPPNTNLNTLLKSEDDSVTSDGTYTLTWEWPFSNGNDKLDTFIVGCMAGGYSPDKLVTVASVNASITVTQLD